MRRTLIITIVLFSLSIGGALAQPDLPDGDGTLTLTQEQVDSALDAAVANIEQVEDLVVDFQDDAVVISATVTDGEGMTYSASTTLVVGVDEDGTVEWQVAAASVNGFALREAQLDAINDAIQASQPATLRDELNAQVIVAVEIDEGSITYSVNEALTEFQPPQPEDLPEPMTPDRIRPIEPDAGNAVERLGARRNN